MIGLPSPAILAGAALVAALAGYSFGLSVERNARVAEVATLREGYAQKASLAALMHAAEVDAVRQTEQDLRGDIDTMKAQRAEEIANAKVETDRVVADLRAGNRRLSIAVKSCAATGTTAGGSTPSASAGPATARADIDDAAAERLIGIAREGDDAIRDLNTCIGSYEALTSSPP